MKPNELRMTVRLPLDAVAFLDKFADEDFTSRNAEIVRSIRMRMRMTAGATASETNPAVIGKTDALQGVNPISQDERTVSDECTY